jgi:hypothetical protein
MKNLLILSLLIIPLLVCTSCATASRANKNAYVRELSVGAGLIVAEKVSGNLFSFFQKCPENVICLDGGRRRPAPGYSWNNKTDPNNLNVRWMSGLTHPEYAHVVAANEESSWIPESGFIWSTGSSNGHRLESENLEVNIEKTISPYPSQPRLLDTSTQPNVVIIHPKIMSPVDDSTGRGTPPRTDIQPGNQPPARFGVLTAEDPKLPIDIRDGPNEQAYNRHYGLVGLSRSAADSNQL